MGILGNNCFILSVIILCALIIITGPGDVMAAQLQLSWIDASSNEDGFKIERSGGGKKMRKHRHKDKAKDRFQQIAVTGANVTIYADNTLIAGVTYCYRVRAFNHAGNSAYSSPACGAPSASSSMSASKKRNAPGRGPATAASSSSPTILQNRSAAPAKASQSNSSSRWPSSIAIFRPSTGEWFLDRDGTGRLDSCAPNVCLGRFGKEGDIPVTGSWTDTEATLPGVFETATASWYLDLNGNGTLDGCEADACRFVYGEPGDLPVVGDWTGSGKSRVGVFRPNAGEWHFDLNGDGEGCISDGCTRLFGQSGDLPVTGDWDGDGKTRIGVFRPATRDWILDFDGHGDGKNCGDACVSFGSADDLPVVGDWDGSGADKIGVYRPSTGEWFLDLNGNRTWDGCAVDLCLGPFGEPGDLPVVGKWM